MMRRAAVLVVLSLLLISAISGCIGGELQEVQEPITRQVGNVNITVLSGAPWISDASELVITTERGQYYCIYVEGHKRAGLWCERLSEE